MSGTTSISRSRRFRGSDSSCRSPGPESLAAADFRRMIWLPPMSYGGFTCDADFPARQLCWGGNSPSVTIAPTAAERQVSRLGRPAVLPGDGYGWRAAVIIATLLRDAGPD